MGIRFGLSVSLGVFKSTVTCVGVLEIFGDFASAGLGLGLSTTFGVGGIGGVASLKEEEEAASELIPSGVGIFNGGGRVEDLMLMLLVVFGDFKIEGRGGGA